MLGVAVGLGCRLAAASVASAAAGSRCLPAASAPVAAAPAPAPQSPTLLLVPAPLPPPLRRDAYLPGVQAQYRSLRLVGCSRPLIVLYTAGVSAEAVEALAAEGCAMQFTAQFHPKGEPV